ncbi:hypothetical protein ADH76_27815 [Enterocloster clostridioformis]|uniref:hypothetical protein n=1 Tax=Enterocloster clostridioformis TaxID=1531 RepID=UPI00080C5DD9|nr:hypothetical protein [Enterocloster clostridioformis]ANU48859.1 hypothetical protein A4V08_26685 [Lachnoclostridium sp. YL32]NDO27086.1 hypothetical protein [Enterocloster clostridioformis]OXE64002.1 hypothetical protein ADH76_27815 [Enterocloster clostridioformis]QQR02224.1 hypothetical protein I5Q83_08020 [Enterocloster clostridioformis]
MAADGSLNFDTKINVKGFEEGISTLSKAMDRLTKAVDGLSSNILNRFNVAGQAMAETSSSAEATSDAVESVGTAADESAKHVKSLQEQMDAISVHAMQDTASDMAQSAPVSAPTSAESLNYDPKAMAAVFGDAASEIHSWSDAIGQYGNQAGMAMNELQQDAAEAEQAVSEASSQGAEQAQGYVGVKESILNAFKNVPQAFGQIPVAAKRELSKIPGIVKSAFSSATRTVLNFGKSLGKGLANKAKQAVSGLKGLGKSSNSVSKSILKLSNMFKLMLIRMAMRAAIQGVKEGMQNLVQYSDGANQSMSNLMSGMTYLKNSFAAAFAPILSYVAPVLNTLINLLATAVGYINQFFSALGGGSTYIRAKKANEDYAASLKKTGGAASKAGKDAKKALAPFDDLVQIQQQGADASGGGGGGASPSDMFETIDIDKGISDFANKLKEMFAAGDWEGIGQLIGQKINEAVQSFTEFISWDNIGAQITAFVTAFTTLFNSLVAKIDWYSIGVMFGTGINTIAHTLYLLLTQIEWFALGNALSQGLMGMVNTVEWGLVGATIGAYFQAQISGLLGFIIGTDWGAIGNALSDCIVGIADKIEWEQLGYLFAAGLNAVFDAMLQFAKDFPWVEMGEHIATSISTFFQTFRWADAGEALSTFVIGILDFLITVVQETDWASFVQGIVDCIEAVDWIGLAGKIYTLLYSALGVAFGALAKFIGTLIADGFAAAKDYFNGKIEECGGNVWEGMLKGVTDAAKGVVTWIKTNVIDPFINGVKAGFGIHSPSTVMAGMGQYLWDGFCNGIKEFFSNPGAFIKANITDPFVNGIKSLLGIHSPSTVLAGVGSNTVAGFNQGVTNEQAASQSVVQSWASGVASWFSDKFGISSGDSAESKKWATSIMRGFNNTVNKNYTQSQSVMETWAENVRKWFVGVDEAQGVNELSWTKFADLIIQAFKVKIEGSHAETQAPVETWARNVCEWFWGDSDTQGTGGMYAAFYNMAKRINEGFANGISDFAYMAKDAIKRWAREAMEEAEEEFDINSPSKEFYGIAEYVVRGFNDGISAMAASSRNTVQKWLDGVLDVFEGVEVQLPIGINIPNAVSYLPRMASGTVVPPRAGEMSTSMRNTAGYGQEETLGYLVAKMDEMISRLAAEGSRPIQIVLNLTGNLAALARVLKPELDKEAARKGVSLVIVGGS